MASGNGNVVLTKDIAEAREATAKYATNLAKAKADGYRIITKMMPNIGYHFLNPSISGFNVWGWPGACHRHCPVRSSWRAGTRACIRPCIRVARRRSSSTCSVRRLLSDGRLLWITTGSS